MNFPSPKFFLNFFFLACVFFSKAQVDCFSCTSEQLSFAKALEDENYKDVHYFLQLKNFNPDFEFSVKYRGGGILHLSHREQYTPFSYLIIKNFPLTENEMKIFFKKMDFDMKENFRDLLKLSYPPLSYANDKKYPAIKISDFLPGKLSEALFLNSLIEVNDSLIRFYVSKGFLKRKYFIPDFKREDPDSPDLKKETGFSRGGHQEIPESFLQKNFALKDSSILELYFRNLPFYFGEYLYTSDYRKGFHHVLKLLDSCKYDQYPQSLKNKNLSEDEYFMELYFYYNEQAAKENALQGSLSVGRAALSMAAFKKGSKRLFGRELNGSRMDTIFRDNWSFFIYFISTDKEKLLAYTGKDVKEEEGRNRFFEVEKMCLLNSGEYYGTACLVPIQNKICMVNTTNGFKKESCFNNAENGKFVHEDLSAGEYLLIYGNGSTKIYTTGVNKERIDSVSGDLSRLDWKFSGPRFYTTIKKQVNGSYACFSLDEKGIKTYTLKKDVENLAGPYFTYTNPAKPNQKGIIELTGEKEKTVLKNKFDSILVLTSGKYFYFLAQKKGEWALYSRAGKKMPHNYDYYFLKNGSVYFDYTFRGKWYNSYSIDKALKEGNY